METGNVGYDDDDGGGDWLASLQPLAVPCYVTSLMVMQRVHGVFGCYLTADEKDVIKIKIASRLFPRWPFQTALCGAGIGGWAPLGYLDEA